VAPDMRGYGGTDAPAEISEYSMLRLAGDVVGIANTLGETSFAVVGHDWGSPLASNVGLFRPDMVRGAALLSVPSGQRVTARVSRRAAGRRFIISSVEPAPARRDLG
jgi:pimeloyl-ACP methyl ester carboxylesterase